MSLVVFPQYIFQSVAEPSSHPRNENIPDDNSAINPVVQQAQQGQQGIQRAMSPSERARLAEQQAQQQQMIAQNRQAAMEKRQRLNGRSSGGQKPVSA